jgi:Mce-associated membrane protein
VTDKNDQSQDSKDDPNVAVDTDTEDPDQAEVTEAEDEAGEDATDNAETAETAAPVGTKRRFRWSRMLALGVLPALALVLGAAAGFLKWQDSSIRTAEAAQAESVQVAKDSTVAMLSYAPDTVEQQLNGARDLLTGEFRDSYTSLINDVVIPGAKEKGISAVATVPKAASVSADENHAVVLVFVNQTVTVGTDPPTDTASSVRVTLDKVDDRWLISEFEPV